MRRSIVSAIALSAVLVVASLWWATDDTRDGPVARLVISPERLDFGGVALHETAERLVVVTNPGDESLTIDRIHAPAPFTSLDASLEVAPGESLPLSIVFSPSEVGDARGTLEFETSAASTRVELLGRGNGLPMIHVDPMSITFGSVAVGGLAKALFTIENRGEGPLDLQDLRITGPFEVAVDRRLIDPGEMGVVEVRFSPPSARPWDTQLVIESNDPRMRRMQLSLFGTGVAEGTSPAIVVSPTGVDFGAVTVGRSAQRWLQIRNAGAAELMISSVTLAAPFHSNTRSRPIAPRSSIRLPVSFSPRESGARLTPMTIHSNDPENGTLVVALMGEGSAGRGASGGDDSDGVRRRETGTQTGATGRTESGDSGEGEAAAESDAFGSDDDATPGSDGPSGPAILEGSEVVLSSYGTPVGNTHVGGITVDPASGTFQLTGVELPTVHAAMNESFTFLPTEGTGTVNELGDMDVWLPITVMDYKGNPGTIDLRLTTGTAIAAVGGSVVTAVGSPVGSDGIATLVGVGAFDSGPLSRDAIRITLRLQVGD